MDYQNFVVETAGALTTVIFNRPEKRNAVNEEVLAELEAILWYIRDDAASRVIIVTGTGNSFSAGADISPLQGITDPAERQHIFVRLRKMRARFYPRIATLLREMEQITIAAVNGYAIGAGWAVVLACDFRIAAETAAFWFPEVDLGVALPEDFTAPLVHLVGPAKAKRILMTVQRFTAREAETWGLVDEVVPTSDVIARAQAFAELLLSKNPHAIAGIKATVNSLTSRQRVLLHPNEFLWADQV